MVRAVIVGAGGHGRVLLDVLQEMGSVEVAGFVDADPARRDQELDGVPVLGNDQILPRLYQEGIRAAVVGIGDNRLRARLAETLEEAGFTLLTAIHPRAVVARTARLGRGVAVLAGAVINTGAVLGTGVIVNTGATVDHDCVLEDFAHVWPGAHLAGRVRIKHFAYVGTGAALIPNTTVGRDSIIGAGAVVIRDIPDDVVAVGVPARIIKHRR